MIRGWRSGILTIAAVVAVALIVAAFILGQFNRSAQGEINARQQFINQNIELSRVNQTLVHALAVAAIRNDDPKLKAMLGQQGITLHPEGATRAVPVASPSSRATDKAKPSHLNEGHP